MILFRFFLKSLSPTFSFLTTTGYDFTPLQVVGINDFFLSAIAPAVPPGAVPVAVRRSAYYGELAETLSGQVMQPTRLTTAGCGEAHGQP